MRCNPFLGSFPAFNATKTNLETGSYTRCMCVWPRTDRQSSSALFFPTTNAKAQLSFQFTNQTRQRARMQTCYVLSCRQKSLIYFHGLFKKKKIQVKNY